MSKPYLLVVQGYQRDESLIQTLQEDYDVHQVYSGEEALYIYEKNVLKIRVVLLDLVLPDLSGTYVLQKMSAISKVPQILVFSDQHDIQLAVSSMKEGAFDYIVIPTTSEYIQEAVNNALDHMAYSESLISNSVSEEPTAVYSEFRFSDRVNMAPDYTKMTILIIEDEPIYRRMMIGFLKDYTVLEAGSCAQAREMIRLHPEIDVILCDMLLGDGTGDYLVPQLKRELPDVEIAVITAYEQMDKAISVLRNGASDYLNKPILKRHLIESIHHLYDLKYACTVMPKVTQHYVETQLSDDAKVTFLNRISSDKQRKGDKLIMGDIYAFFPELKAICIPDTFTLPERVNQDILGFIQDLKLKIKAQTSNV